MKHQLFGVPLSPFVRKTQLAFAHRGIDYELVQTRPGADDPAFVAVSPLKKIPGIKTSDGHGFADSSVIIAYFERTQEGKSLYPKAAGDFARALMIEEIADTKLSEAASGLYFQKVLQPVVFKKDSDNARIDAILTHELPERLAIVESLLANTEWAVGDVYSVADVALGTHWIGLMHAGFTVDAVKFPKTAKHIKAFMALDSAQQQIALEKSILKQLAA